MEQGFIHELVKKYTPDICAMRRHIHENPELSGEEVETAAFMAAKLRSFGIDVQEHVAGTTAVLGTLKGGKPGPVIALRADMDALPMTEETGLPFASNFAGKMHACGHDGHMSILLGAAEVLSQVKDDIPGTVVFICQPSEEKSPVGGAKGLVASGALDGVDAVYGLHVWPTLPSGKIGVLPGPMMAASDHIRIVLNGKASHAAMPHKGVDTIVAAAQFLTAAQTIISRRVNPLYPAVLTFGKITGGTRYNVVADTVEIEGTCRTYHAEAQDAVEAHTADDELLAFGALFDLARRVFFADPQEGVHQFFFFALLFRDQGYRMQRIREADGVIDDGEIRSGKGIASPGIRQFRQDDDVAGNSRRDGDLFLADQGQDFAHLFFFILGHIV